MLTGTYVNTQNKKTYDRFHKNHILKSRATNTQTRNIQSCIMPNLADINWSVYNLET